MTDLSNLTRVGALALILGLAACVETATDPRPVAEFNKAFSNCKRQTGAQGQYVVGPKASNGVPVVLAGTGGNLRGEVLINSCIAQNLKTSVAELPPTPQKVEPGKLPLPSQYPLQPGDAELWPTLTRAQQERALQFLADGGTIRASLRTE